MEIKNVRVNEIHWSIDWNASQEANKRLKDKIGETSKYFAQLKVGNATYNWMVDTIGKWRPMGMAPDSDKAAVMEKAEQIRQEVFDKLPNDDNLARKICQVPNYEEYIFYKDNGDGTLDVVITGWGFHNFKKAGPFVETWPPRPVMHDTTIAFVIDGVRQPQRTFSVVTPKMQKPDVTDEQGVRTYKEYAGVSITVIDDATKRQFTFTTEEKDQVLEFDITTKTSVIVRATLDGQPLSGESMAIDYDGQHHELPLVNGEAVFSDLSFNSGASCTATLRGEQRIEPLSGSTATTLSFEFTTPPEEPKEEPKAEPVIATLSVIDAQGQPMKNAQYRLTQGGQTIEGQLNEQGSVQFTKDNFTLDQPLQAHITPEDGRQIEPIDFTLENNENEYVLQENAPKKGGFNLMNLIVALLILAALAALVIFALKPGTEELTRIINKNFF